MRCDQMQPLRNFGGCTTGIIIYVCPNGLVNNCQENDKGITWCNQNLTPVEHDNNNVLQLCTKAYNGQYQPKFNTEVFVAGNVNLQWMVYIIIHIGWWDMQISIIGYQKIFVSLLFLSFNLKIVTTYRMVV